MCDMFFNTGEVYPKMEEFKFYNEIIRNLREGQDLTQLDIAKRIGTSQQQYSKYETGGSEFPARVVKVLADYFGMSTDYLLGRTDCKEGVDGLNEMIISDYTIGMLISNVLALSAEGRADAIKYIDLQLLKENFEKSKIKGGSRP